MPFIKEYEKQFKQMIKTTEQLVQFPSVYEEGDRGTPFGVSIDSAANFIMDLAKKFGLTTFKDEGGKYCYVECGKGEQLIGILTHIDVHKVFDEKAWETDPFELVTIDNVMYGRGIETTKSSIVQCLYAMKTLIDIGHKFKNRIRMIITFTGESTKESIAYYKEKEEIPEFSFSPHGRFPVFHAESEIIRYHVTSKQQLPFNITGGGAKNIVMPQCKYKGPLSDMLEEELQELEYQYTIEEGSIIVLGESAHAMENWKGKSAFNMMCIGLYNTGIHSDIIDFVAEELGETTDGEFIFGDISDTIVGPARLTITQVKMVDEDQFFNLDVRLPIDHDGEHSKTLLKKVIERHNLEVAETEHEEKIFFKESNKYIKLLADAYTAHTDEKSNTATTASGTFARYLPNTVTFGPSFHTDEAVKIENNENLSIDDFKKAGKIYMEAIYNLAK